MSAKKGRRLALSLNRRFICDVLAFAQKTPSIPVQRIMNVQEVKQARASAAKPISWTVIFLKAFALVAQEFPALRRAYMSFPVAHLYEHPRSIATVAIEREYQGEQAVFMALLNSPEEKSLARLDGLLRLFRETPVEELRPFQFSLRIARLPQFVRRILCWLVLHISGDNRARRLGTFAFSVYSALGAESLHPLTPLTSTLNYGIIGPDGTVPVRIVYDHRVMDGSTVARALARLEEILNHDIADELRTLAQSDDARTLSDDEKARYVLPRRAA